MSEPRKDTIIWDEETKQHARDLAAHFDRSMSAEIRYRINAAWTEVFASRVLVDPKDGKYETEAR